MDGVDDTMSFVKSWSDELQTKRIQGMHTPTDCVVLKGVPASRVKGRASEPC
jgi:hypothetical protein